MITFLKVLRPIAAVVLFFVTWQFCMVSEYIAWAKEPTKPTSQERKPSGAERFGKSLEEVDRLARRVAEADASADISADVERVITLTDELDALNAEVEEEFAATGRKLDDINAAPVIHERQRKAVAEYREKFKELKRLLSSARKNRANGMELRKDAEDLAAFLKANKPKSRHIPLDPNNLPHRAAKAKKILPKQTQEEYEKDERFKPTKKQHGWNRVLPKEGVKIASADGDLRGLFTVAQATQPVGIPAPTPEDLAPTIDAQLTDAIRAKASELGNQPLPIYQWVRNNVEFMPTYGSIQGADYCLQTKQCNAFDTSSLLIALLRASGIHARYVYGTIEIPADKAMNWVGGVTKPELAVQLLNMGGIPAVGVVSGSQITKIRLEHVWVEGWIDYVPSRGAIHRAGDNWIPMDASWKQYTYTDGIDLAAAVPFDAAGFMNHITSTATIDEARGSISGIDAEYIRQQMDAYQSEVGTYIDRVLPGAKVDDVLPRREIASWQLSTFPSVLPRRELATGARLATVPDSLRYKVVLAAKDRLGLMDAFSVTKALPEVAGKRITMGYVPATADDQAVINQYLEAEASAMPSYLVEFVPYLDLEGLRLANGPKVGMGERQEVVLTILAPSGVETQYARNFNGGEVGSVLIHTASISSGLLARRHDGFYDSPDHTGEMLFEVIQAYWSELDAFNRLSSRVGRVLDYRMPSYGWAIASESIEELWGVPFSSSFKSREVDIQNDLRVVKSRSGDGAAERGYLMNTGIISSYLEGMILDQMFSERLGEGISAARILELVNLQSVPIYAVSQQTLSSVLPSLDVDEDVLADITNAVSAGYLAVVPARRITHSGWTGSGYILADPASGAARYMISGGLGGGSAPTADAVVMPIPDIPIVGAAALVVESLMNGAGMFFMAQNTVGTGNYAAASMLCIAIPASAALEAAILAALFLAVFFILANLIKGIVDRYKAPRVYRLYRHYTRFESAEEIWSAPAPRYILSSGWWGDLLVPGVYLTDILREPATLLDRIEIATLLRMPPPPDSPDPDRVASYIDVEVDVVRVHLLSWQSRAPHQHIYPFRTLREDGGNVRFVNHGPFSPPTY